MERYTLEQRIKIVQIYYKNNENCAETVRQVRALYGNNTPSRTAIMKLIAKFERYGQVSDIKVPYRARRATTDVNILAVAKSLVEQPQLSIPKRAKLLGISQTSLHRILTDELQMNKSKSEGQPKAVKEHGGSRAAVAANGGSAAAVAENAANGAVVAANRVEAKREASCAERIVAETTESEGVTVAIASDDELSILDASMEDFEDNSYDEQSESSQPSYDNENSLSPIEQEIPASIM